MSDFWLVVAVMVLSPIAASAVMAIALGAAWLIAGEDPGNPWDL